MALIWRIRVFVILSWIVNDVETAILSPAFPLYFLRFLFLLFKLQPYGSNNERLFGWRQVAEGAGKHMKAMEGEVCERAFAIRFTIAPRY